MKNWYSIWGYRSLDFGAFPLYVENETEYVEICAFPPCEAFKIRFQNTFGTETLHIEEAWLVVRDGKKCPVTVNGQRRIAISPGKRIWSDEVIQKAEAGQKIQIKLRWSGKNVVKSACTFLANSMTGVWYSKNEGGLTGSFFEKEPLHQCVTGLDQIAVWTEEPVFTVVAFGDSITHMSRWTAPFAERLLETYQGRVTLLNMGICGNRLLHDASVGSGHGGWFGERGIVRFERDVFANGFVPDAVILLEGINDILHPAIGEAPPEEAVSAEEIVAGLESCADTAHYHQTKIYAATLLPFKGCKDHWRSWHEEKRNCVNDLLRRSTVFDGIFDFDSWAKDPADESRLNPKGGSEDKLHPGIEGGKTLAEQIDLSLLCGK